MNINGLAGQLSSSKGWWYLLLAVLEAGLTMSGMAEGEVPPLVKQPVWDPE